MKLKNKFWAKLLAVLLLCVSSLICIGSVLCSAQLYKLGGYTKTCEQLQKDFLNDRGTGLTVMTGEALNSFVQPQNLKLDGAWCFQLVEDSGELLYDGLAGRETIWQGEGERTIYVEAQSGLVIPDNPYVERSLAETELSLENAVRCHVRGYILKDAEGYSTIMRSYELLGLMHTYKSEMCYTAALSLIVALVCFIFLMRAAGHREDGSISGGIIERLPFDVFSLVEIFIVMAFYALALECTEGGERLEPIMIALMLLCIVAAELFALLWCMSLAVRIKLGTTIKSCLFYRGLRFLLRGLRLFAEYTIKAVKAVPMFPRAMLITGGVLLLEFFWTATVDNRRLLILGWFIERGALLAGLIYALWCMRRLLEAGKALAAGGLEHKIDTKSLHGEFKTHAENLNCVTEGLNLALNERMKAERLRTELITNVSHDIKTPLTSIISYVDLLEKEQPENEKMREYLEVLSRQSAKLKKLIDDLLEASKASTGSLKVHMEKCDLGVLLQQCIGEYLDKLSEAGLELIIEKTQEDVCIMADGRHMWRVLDNLLANIKKYAQPGTRVYIDLTADDKRAELVLRNISASRLKVSGEELAERFVRGDSARTGEGSGLGLNIAQSLTRLQGGEMELSVDGDLFKVSLSFPRL